MKLPNSSNILGPLYQAFAEAVVHGDRLALSGLLSNKGVYEIQDDGLSRVETGKPEFVEWILSRRLEAESLGHYVDTCTGCKVGCPVLLFNYGRFPAIPQDSSSLEKTGLHLKIKGGKITGIKFCHQFHDITNNYVFMNNINRKLKVYMRKHQCTMQQAQDAIKENPFLYLNL